MASTTGHQPNGNLPSTSASANASSIEIDHRTSRSFFSGALIASLRPFRGRLIKSGKPYPPGSPELKPPTFVYDECNVHERTVRDIHIYDINVRSRSTAQYVAYQDLQHGTRIEPPSLAGPRLKPTISPSKDEKRKSTISPLPADLQAQTPAQANGAPRPPTSSSQTQARPTSSSTNNNLAPTRTNASTTSTTDPGLPLTLTRTKTRDFAHHATPTRPRPRQIYYLAGGSWRQPPTKDHWKFLVSLVLRLTADGVPTTVAVISYPLAPHTPAAIALPMLERMYTELFRPVVLASPDPDPTKEGSFEFVEGTETMPEIIFAGDSSGGNIALALVCEMLRKDPKARCPDSLMLISPTVRMAVDHPKIADLESKDPILSRKQIEGTHAGWCGVGDSKLKEEDPRVSPYYADLSLLTERGVVVNGVNAGYDILGPDCEDFVKRLGEVGVRGKWLQWDKMMHVFPLTAAYGIQEGKEGVEWIIKTIQGERTRR